MTLLTDVPLLANFVEILWRCPKKTCSQCSNNHMLPSGSETAVKSVYHTILFLISWPFFEQHTVNSSKNKIRYILIGPPQHLTK